MELHVYCSCRCEPPITCLAARNLSYFATCCVEDGTERSKTFITAGVSIGNVRLICYNYICTLIHVEGHVNDLKVRSRCTR